MDGVYYRDKYNDLWLGCGNGYVQRVKDGNIGHWWGGKGLVAEL